MLFSSLLSLLHPKLVRGVGLFLVSIVAASCFDVVQWTYWHEGNYRVSDDAAGDTCKNLTFRSFLRVVCIHRLGLNDRYIIAESCHFKSKAIRYWILDMNRDKESLGLNADEIVEGPYTLDEFEQRKIDLHIKDLEFQEDFE
jgi:hypothetical protein